MFRVLYCQTICTKESAHLNGVSLELQNNCFLYSITVDSLFLLMRTQGQGQAPSSMQTLFPLSNKQVSVNYVFFPLAFPLSHVCLNSLQLPQHVSVLLFKSTADCFYSIYWQFLVKVPQNILFYFNLDIDEVLF